VCGKIAVTRQRGGLGGIASYGLRTRRVVSVSLSALGGNRAEIAQGSSVAASSVDGTLLRNALPLDRPRASSVPSLGAGTPKNSRQQLLSFRDYDLLQNLLQNCVHPGITRGTAAHAHPHFVLTGRCRDHCGACGSSLWTVFKTVARPASWSRVGSTPMHLRQSNLNSNSAQMF
jgi:hypothetical protein